MWTTLLENKIKQVFLFSFININMNYLISSFDCIMFANEIYEIKSNVKYEIEKDESNISLIFSNDTHPFVFDFRENENVLIVKSELDCYYFLFPKTTNDFLSTRFKYTNFEIEISLLRSLKITASGVLICEKNVENLKFSHYETFKDYCLIYFNGRRNFVVILKNDQVCFADYYDECNILDNERWFMKKLYDSLNHGMVCKIEEKDFSTYLVYLDEYEMCLKPYFVANVFLDCVLSGNFNYCNNLLCEDLKLKDVTEIKNFFPKFDYFYPIDQNKFILINKNTLAGIFEFCIDNVQVTNIKSLK